MKKFLFCFLFAISGLTQAQNQMQMGTVVQAQPVFENVNVGSICTPSVNYGGNGYQQPVQRDNWGAVIGAVAGAAIGNGIGRGDGRIAAMVIGSGTGAIVGDRLGNQNNGQQYQQPQQDCRPQYQQRQTGTQVVVDFEGRRVNGFLRRVAQLGDQVRVSVNINIAE